MSQKARANRATLQLASEPAVLSTTTEKRTELFIDCTWPNFLHDRLIYKSFVDSFSVDDIGRLNEFDLSTTTVKLGYASHAVLVPNPFFA